MAKMFTVLHLIFSYKEKRDNNGKVIGTNFFYEEEKHMVPMNMALAESCSSYVKSWGADDYIIVHTDGIDRNKYPAAQQLLDKLVDEGYAAHGKLYAPIFISGSQGRQGNFTTMNENDTAEFLNWARLGYPEEKFNKLSPNKQAKYLGLYFSSVRDWAEIWKNDPILEKGLPKPNFKEVAILPDVMQMVPGTVDEIDNDSIVRKILDKIWLKITDGQAYYLVNDTGWTDKERKEFMRKVRTFSFRAPWMKGYMSIILLSFFKRIFAYRKWKNVTHDLYGDEVDLFNCKIITFASVFKASKCFEHYAEYAEAAEKFGHSFYICVEDHGQRKNGIPYQQLQTLPLTEEDVEKLADMTAGKLGEAVKSASVKSFMRTPLGKAVTEYPSMLQNNVVWLLTQMTYANQRRRMAGGRLPRMAHHLFCAIDPVAIFEGIMGEEIKGILPAKTCYTRIYKTGRWLDCTRCPHLDHAHAIRWNLEIPAWAHGLFLGNGIWYSSHDLTMILHQMDFDGDESHVTDCDILVEAAKRGFEKYNNVPFHYEANDAHGEAQTKDYMAALKDMCRNSAPVPIGIYVNALTKIWATGYRAFHVGMLTKAGNGNIDSFGHGAEKSTAAADRCVADMKKMPKPEFLAWAHAHVDPDDGVHVIMPYGWNVQQNDESQRTSFKMYASSVVDQYSALVRYILPADMRELIDPDKLETFDSRKLRCHPDRTIVLEGLISERTGLFNQLVEATMAQLEEINRSNSLKAVPDYEEMRRNAIRAELLTFAESHGATEEDVIDALIFNIFYKMTRTNNFATSLVRVLFLVYGDRILHNLQVNLGHTANEETTVANDDNDDSMLVDSCDDCDWDDDCDSNDD